jgi:hypothetical protein
MALAWVAVLLAACASSGPAASTATPVVALASGAAAAAQPQPAASSLPSEPTVAPAPDRPFYLPDALLSPGDLGFDGAYSESGWRRCDDYAVGKNLQDFRSKYDVAESAAAIWEYGSECGSTERAARLDEYALQMEDIDAAVQLSGFFADTSYFDQLAPEKRKQVREFERESVLVRASLIEPIGGKKQYIAEMIGQDGRGIVYLRLATADGLSDETYQGMARQVLERMRAAERAE